VLPAGLAAPWCAVSAALDMPPVLVYATYNLYNWRRLDGGGAVALGNTCCLHNFLGGVDEEWFRLVHVAIEAQAAAAVASLPGGLAAAAAGDMAAALRTLEGVTAALVAMQVSCHAGIGGGRGVARCSAAHLALPMQAGWAAAAVLARLVLAMNAHHSCPLTLSCIPGFPPPTPSLRPL
jgi:hypothetical protein